MTAPTKKVRDLVYRRDNNRCISCGSHISLSFQHRQATGMGGSKVKPLPHEGLTACLPCNESFEADKQSDALYWGWKVRRFCPVAVDVVPVYYRIEAAWFLLNADGSRDRINEATANEYRTLAGILPEGVM